MRLSKVSNEWIAYDEEAATAAGQRIDRRHRAVPAEHAHRQLDGLPADQPARLPDVPPNRHADSGAGSVGEGDRRRRLREGGPVCRCDGRNRRTGALDRRPQAGRRGDGRTALGQVQRLQADGRVAGRGVTGGVRAAAAFGPGADARRRRRRFLSCSTKRRAPAAGVRVRSRRDRRARAFDPAR